MEYGVIIAPKHLAFNDTEINRTGISVFMTEQQARENELRGTQAAIVENAQCSRRYDRLTTALASPQDQRPHRSDEEHPAQRVGLPRLWISEDFIHER